MIDTLLLPLAGVALAALPLPQLDSAVDLITEGRRLLEQGEVESALERFEAAVERDEQSVASRVWLVRGWLANGQLDEALTATDELKALGAPKADLDYLYGLGFYANALREASGGGGGVYTQGQFVDATRFLVEATDADAERYGDAFLPLAEAAWYATDLAVASEAAARAVERRPDDTAALLVRGRVAFSRYTDARTNSEPGKLIDQRWAETRDAFEAAVAAFGQPEEELPQYELAGAWQQRANLHLWREDTERAAIAFGNSMAWDPRATDFNGARTSLDEARFAELVSGARARFDELHPEGTFVETYPGGHPGRALLAWWSGYAHFEAGQRPAAEQAFLAAIEGNGDFLNSWYYIFRAAYGQREYDQAMIALRSYWRQDPNGLLAKLGEERELSLRILEVMIGWLIDPDKQVVERYAEAALLAEITTQLKPEEPRYWNNLGLFLRDYGDQLKAKLPPPSKAELDELFERAYDAYAYTLEVSPEHPAYLNDTAVMFHYYLEREYDTAEAMYELALERAELELAKTTLSTADRDWFETAKKDAGENLEKLRKKREREAASEAEPADDAAPLAPEG